MEKVRLDMKDKRILDALDKDANITFPKLSKKVGVSRQVAEYRVKNLLFKKTIYDFHTLVDVGKIGYSNFRIHIRLKNISEETYTHFAKELFTKYPVFWVAFVSGSFDIIVDLFARNLNEFEEVFSKILQKNKNIIQNYETLSILELNLYEYNYFLKGKRDRSKIIVHKNLGKMEIDDIDKNILKLIKHNSRCSYESLSSKVGLSRNAVKRRIQKLETQKVIAGYKAFINFHHLNKHSFKIFIKYNNSKREQETSLLETLKNKIGILATLKLLGKWNLDIEIHEEDIKTLQKFIIELRNKFNIIEDYEIVQIIDDYGIDFYPDKIN
jgi:DNA-binding Lrp family transcriptional regulator